MKRAFGISVALVVAATWTLSACAKEPAANPLGKWQAGTNYVLLPAPQATNVKAGKVEVTEVFWYGCGHCYALDPTLEEWKKTKPAYVEFIRMPVMWGVPQQQHAKLFYTLQALNRLDLHTKVFDAIHKEHNMLAAPSETDARAMQLAFAKANGISEQDFNTAFDSMTVATNLARAQEATLRYAVAGVPLMIVNGKYTTDVATAGDPAKLIALVNDLAASEKKR